MNLTDPNKLPRAIDDALSRAVTTSKQEKMPVPLPAQRTYVKYLEEDAFGSDAALLEIMLNASLRLSADAKRKLQILYTKEPMAISMNLDAVLGETLEAMANA